MTQTIEIDNLGPISHIDFDIPDDKGGVFVFRGTSGVGKTTVLRAMSGLLGDKDSLSTLTPSDGCDKAEIKGLGRSVKLAQRTSTTGAVSVPWLAGKLDVSLLAESKLVDPIARNKARIRALVSIGGKQLKPKDLLGDKLFAEYSSQIDLDEIQSADDPVAMADKLKRALSSLALEKERESDRTAGAATAKRQEAGDVDTLSNVSQAEAVRKHREATRLHEEAKAKRESHHKVEAANFSIVARIAEKEAETGSIVDLEAGLDATFTEIETREGIVRGLEKRLADAKYELSVARAKLGLAQGAIKDLRSLYNAKAVPVDDVSDEELQSLAESEAAWTQTLQDVLLVEKRRAALAESKSKQEESAKLANEALGIRAAAEAVQENVRKALPEGPIYAKDGVLVVDYKKRKAAVPYDELSTGEKWKIAMQYAIATVGTGGVIPLSQEAWQALGPELKSAIAEQAREAKVCVITGEVGGGSLRLEEFEGK